MIHGIKCGNRMLYSTPKVSRTELGRTSLHISASAGFLISFLVGLNSCIELNLQGNLHEEIHSVSKMVLTIARSTL